MDGATEKEQPERRALCTRIQVKRKSVKIILAFQNVQILVAGGESAQNKSNAFLAGKNVTRLKQHFLAYGVCAGGSRIGSLGVFVALAKPT